MSTDIGADWMDAALVDLEARKAKIEAMIANIREMQASAGGGSPAAPGPGGSGGVRPGAFLKMSIPDATKKHLENVRQKQSTQELMDALEKGGLPRAKYNTLYSILARRAKQVGDIINMQGDWALAEWYPNYRPKAKATNGGKDTKSADEASESGEATA
jgi:hypothetical protein